MRYLVQKFALAAIGETILSGAFYAQGRSEDLYIQGCIETQCSSLDLSHTDISDHKPLSEIVNLQELWLKDTNVTDTRILNDIEGLHIIN